jgi:hypothetical protein
MTSNSDLSFGKISHFGCMGVRVLSRVAQRVEKAQHIMKVNNVEIMRLVAPRIFEGVWGSSSRGISMQLIFYCTSGKKHSFVVTQRLHPKNRHIAPEGK